MSDENIITISEKDLEEEIKAIVNMAVNTAVISTVRQCANIADKHKGYLQIGEMILKSFGIAPESPTIVKG